MPSTLAERLEERMRDLGLKTNAELARLVKLKPPSTLLWLQGTTKNIKGDNLLNVARQLGVNPEWLSTGRGPKLPGEHAARAQEDQPFYHRDSNIAEAVQILEAMDPKARADALSFLRVFAAKKGASPTKRARVPVPAAVAAAA